MATDIYSDVNPEYIRDTTKGTMDLTKDLDEDAVKNSIRNILMTKKLERRMLPEFGASLEQMLFEPMDENTSHKIGNIILEEIEYWEPRVEVTNVTVESDIDKSLYQIKLEYNIKTVSGINTTDIEFVLQQY
jgi:hypothetical protein